MTNEEYVAGVLTTEANPDNPDLVHRFHKAAVFSNLMEHINRAITVGDQLDDFKKYLFYGKETLSRLLVNNTRVIDEATSKKLDIKTIRLIHAVLGVTTEATEMLQAIVTYLVQDVKLDEVNLQEEGGDMFWYLGIYVDTLKTSFEALQIKNNTKLTKKRYKAGFTEKEAIHRNVVEERKELENSVIIPLTLEQIASKVLDGSMSINKARSLMHMPPIEFTYDRKELDDTAPDKTVI